MKIRVLLLFAAFLMVSATSYAQEVPSIVTLGLDIYKNSTYSDAFRVWLKGSPLEADKTTALNLKGAFTQVESMYGKNIGYEILRTVAVSRSTTRVYVEIRFERGPLFILFDCYKSPAGWLIPSVRFQTEADKLLPEDFFFRKK